MGINFLDAEFVYNKNKKEKVVALENINLNINKNGEFIAICGKTGSGKSTLIQLMNLLLTPTNGKLTILDYNIKLRKKQSFDVNILRQKIGLVFQFPEYQLFSETVFKDVEFGVKNISTLKSKSKDLVEKTLKDLNIDESIWHKSPFKLSGGQQRKVAIAGILAMEPEIIILDEPTRGLDHQAQDEIMTSLYNIHKSYNKTIIFITHDMDLVYEYANRVLVLNDKKIVYDGNNKDLFLNNVYKENSLKLPTVLKIINKLNSELNYNLKPLNSLDEILKEIKKC